MKTCQYYTITLFSVILNGMERFKLIIFSIVILAVVGLVGYWAVRSLEPGDIHANRQRQKELEERNRELEEEIEKLKSDLAVLQPAAPEEEIVTENTEPPVSAISYKYQSLIGALEELIADNVVMKEKSRGTRVGTLQTFLNIYFYTSKKIDNDFGKTTKTDLTSFQKKEGLTADGEAGPTTYQKMIDWLKKQG